LVKRNSLFGKEGRINEKISRVADEGFGMETSLHWHCHYYVVHGNQYQSTCGYQNLFQIYYFGEYGCFNE
jgi:hypothetical protein